MSSSCTSPATKTLSIYGPRPGLAVPRAVAMLECLRHQRQTLAQAVPTRLKPTPADEQLLSVIGIGPIVA